ncbi:MAG: putative adenylyltransferase/sulfurtransferase MoeZ [Pseudomonadota bacterium]|jgi:rhodanese-related sulfurtransferase
MNPLRRALLFCWVLAALPRAVLAAPTWPDIKRLIQARFAGVAHIDKTRLHTWPAQTPVLLLDVRAAHEFALSHVHTAVHTPTLTQAHNAVQHFRATAPQGAVVLYCSVGYRSAHMAQALRRQGVTAVYNLEGGIFEWANANLPVVQGRQRAQFVHPFDKHWGGLLRADLHPPQQPY